MGAKKTKLVLKKIVLKKKIFFLEEEQEENVMLAHAKFKDSVLGCCGWLDIHVFSGIGS